MFLYIIKHKNTAKFFLFFRIFRAKVMKKRMPPHHCEGIPKIVVIMTKISKIMDFRQFSILCLLVCLCLVIYPLTPLQACRAPVSSRSRQRQ